jgi:MraZ protein
VEIKPVQHAILYGEHELTIDEKNRIVVPAEVRNSIEAARDGEGFFLIIGPNRKPWVYPDRYYQQLVSLKAQQEITPDEDLLVFDQMNFAMASKVDPDKQGRLTLPDKLLRRTRTEREITLIGVRDHLELWNRAEWEAQFQENLEKYREITERAKRARQMTSAATQQQPQQPPPQQPLAR